MSLTLTALPGRFAVCRLGASDAVPDWTRGEVVSITRTEDELSIICDESAVPEAVRAERGWTCFKVGGPLPFGMVGVAAALTTALAQAGISVIVVGTFDTDYLLVKGERSEQAVGAWEAAGFSIGA
ncbi:MAG TPA: ACT domain-containing protein [Thermoanaerobaculia bacterium]|nr:ACT domain-containing protein [Thermoanaerobaculia bacterium]